MTVIIPDLLGKRSKFISYQQVNGDTVATIHSNTLKSCTLVDYIIKIEIHASNIRSIISRIRNTISATCSSKAHTVINKYLHKYPHLM
jgi:hypothetical protein